MLPLLKTLVDDLSSINVPASYANANSAMLVALNEEGQGLSDRDAALVAKDDARFGAAVASLGSAADHMVKAYALFPASAAPTPQMFGRGKHFS